MNPINPKKRLLIISYPFPPNPSAGAVRSERFAKYLSEDGWNIDVITIKPQKRADLPEQFHHETIRVHRTSTLDPWLWLSKQVPKNIILRAVRSVLMRIFSFPDHMLLWLPFAVIRGLSVCRNKTIDAIYTTSPPHSTQVIGYLLSKITGIPWVADFRDPWTLNAYKNNGSFDDLLLKISSIMEKAVYKEAAIILTNTLANRKKLIDHFPMIDEKKIVYLPNGWEEFPQAAYGGRIREDHGLIIVHAGTFYPRFKPYGLFHALSFWKKRQCPSDYPVLHEKNIRVILLGSNDLETRRMIVELDLENMVEIRQWVEQDEARQIMCGADMLLTTLGTGIESATYIPSKIYEYIAAKKPIIGFFPEGAACDLIRETRTGHVFTNDDPLPVIEFLQLMIKKKGHKGIVYDPDEKTVQSYHIKNRIKELGAILQTL
jgi:glycosyltransferase involved in cell wall biosynthesis